MFAVEDGFAHMGLLVGGVHLPELFEGGQIILLVEFGQIFGDRADVAVPMSVAVCFALDLEGLGVIGQEDRMPPDQQPYPKLLFLPGQQCAAHVLRVLLV
jgi:hypothetical protein